MEVETEDDVIYRRYIEKLKVSVVFGKINASEIELLQKLRFNSSKKHSLRISPSAERADVRFNKIDAVKKQRLEFQERVQEDTRQTAEETIKDTTGLNTQKNSSPRIDKDASSLCCLQMLGWQKIQEVCEDLGEVGDREKPEKDNWEPAKQQHVDSFSQFIDKIIPDIGKLEKPAADKEQSLISNEQFEKFIQSCAEVDENSKRIDGHDLQFNQNTIRSLKTARQTADETIKLNIVFGIQNVVEEFSRQEASQEAPEKENIFARYQFKKPESKMQFKPKASESTVPDLKLTRPLFPIFPKPPTTKSTGKVETLSEKFKFDLIKKYEAPLRSLDSTLNTSAAGSSKLLLKPKDGSKGKNQELQRSALSNMNISTYLDSYCQKTFID